jgi:hypothetical protein
MRRSTPGRVDVGDEDEVEVLMYDRKFFIGDQDEDCKVTLTFDPPL